MTVYNGVRYLKTTMQSVLRQSYKDFEFLIIDDCSQDHSASVIQSFADQRIKIHHNMANIGQTKSLNIGLKLARGKYIARIDSDDLVFPNWLLKQFSFIEKNPQFAVVSAPAIIIDGTGRIKRILKSLSSKEDILLKTLASTPINHVGSLIRKSTVLEAGGYNDNFRVAADFELWSRLLAKGLEITSTREILTAIRVHELSISKTQKENVAFLEVASIIEKNFHDLAKYSITEQDAKLIARLDYQIESLKSDDLAQVRALLDAAYRNMEGLFCLSRPFTQKRLREMIKVAHIKKIFDSIRNDNLGEARSIARDYMKKEGFSAIIFFLFLFSYMGKFFVRRIPSAYKILGFGVAKIKLYCCQRSQFLAASSSP